MTKRESSFDIRVVIYIGRVSIGNFFVIEGVSMRDIVRFLCIFFSFFYIYLMYISLWPFDIHCTFICFISTDVYYSPIFTCVVSFLSLCTWFLYIVCNLLFLFHTKMPWWILFKVFQKCKLLKSSCHKLSSYKIFQEFVLIVFNKWVWVEWFITSLIYSFVCCGFVTDCQMRRLLGYMWFNVRNICQIRIG